MIATGILSFGFKTYLQSNSPNGQNKFWYDGNGRILTKDDRSRIFYWGVFFWPFVEFERKENTSYYLLDLYKSDR